MKKQHRFTLMGDNILFLYAQDQSTLKSSTPLKQMFRCYLN